MKWFKSQSGFSLIEVMIALGIFAITAASVMPSVARQMQINQEDDMTMRAIYASKNKMAELEAEIELDMLKGKFPDNVSKEGKFEGAYEGMSWEYSVRKVEIPLSDNGGANMNPIMGNIIKTVLKDISKAVRELKLTVRWWDDEDEEADRIKKELILTTHIINFKQK